MRSIEGLPFDQLHRQEVDAVGLLDRVHADHSRVVEGGEHRRLAPEAVEPLRVRGHLGRQDLERHLAAELGVGGAPHLSHPAGAERFGDAVVGEGRADHCRLLEQIRPPQQIRISGSSRRASNMGWTLRYHMSGFVFVDGLLSVFDCIVHLGADRVHKGPRERASIGAGILIDEVPRLVVLAGQRERQEPVRSGVPSRSVIVDRPPADRDGFFETLLEGQRVDELHLRQELPRVEGSPAGRLLLLRKPPPNTSRPARGCRRTTPTGIELHRAIELREGLLQIDPLPGGCPDRTARGPSGSWRQIEGSAKVAFGPGPVPVHPARQDRYGRLCFPVLRVELERRSARDLPAGAPRGGQRTYSPSSRCRETCRASASG